MKITKTMLHRYLEQLEEGFENLHANQQTMMTILDGVTVSLNLHSQLLETLNARLIALETINAGEPKP